MGRLADFYFNKSPTLNEMKKAHGKLIQDYNTQIHYSYREHQDGVKNAHLTETGYQLPQFCAVDTWT